MTTPTKTAPRTNEQALVDLRAISARLGKPMSWKAYNAARDDGMLSAHTLMKRLQATWTEVCQAAGVEPGARSRPAYHRLHGEEALWKAVADYLGDDTSSGSYADFATWCMKDTARPGAQTVRNSLGKWSDIKARVVRDAAGDPL